MGGGPSTIANSNTIVSNYFYGNNIGINAGKNHSIIGNIIKNIPWNPMRSADAININNVSNIQINQNSISNSLGGIDLSSIVDGNILRNIMSGNGSGISLGSGQGANPNSYRVNMNFNTILGVTNNNAITMRSQLGSLEYNISIYSNYITAINNGSGIQNQGANRVNISRNTIINGGINISSNNLSGGVYPYSNIINTNSLTGKGISLQNGYGHSIIGNVIKNMLPKSNYQPTAIAVNSVSNLQVNFNAITNCY